MKDGLGRDRRQRGWNPFAPARETLIDRKIRESMEEGGWENLPFQGERLPLEDDSAAGDRALGHRMLKQAGFAPPWIEADKEARRQLAARDALLAAAHGSSALGAGWRRRQLDEIVRRANAAIAWLNAEAPSDRQHRRPLELAVEVTKLEAAERSDREGSRARAGSTPQA
jgi:hypothetical protein